MHITQKARIASGLTRIVYLLLAISIVAANLLHEPPRYIVCALQLLPLALVAPGIVRGSFRSSIWLCFILLLYFFGYVNSVFAPNRSPVDFALLSWTVLLFTTALLHARWQAQAERIENT